MPRLLLLLSLLLLPGCQSCAPTVTVPATEGIPVTLGKVDLEDLPGAIGEREEPDIVITVPVSDKETVIPIYREKLTAKERILTNKPQYRVESTNSHVTAVQPKKSLWWRKALVYIACFVLAVLIIAAFVWRVMNINPISWLKR